MKKLTDYTNNVQDELHLKIYDAGDRIIGIRRQLIVNFKLKLLIFIELHQIISYK
jgi:hypothetical protein